MALLEVDGVSKSYSRGIFGRQGRLRVLDGIELRLNAGDVLALMGANGSGKTTLLKILGSIVAPDAGLVRVEGLSLAQGAVRSRVGLASGDDRSFYLRLSTRENLRFFAGLHGMSSSAREARIGELASELGLEPFIDRRLDRCSAGMRCLAGIARALLAQPAVLLLDEPSRSLDSENTRRIHDLLRTSLRKRRVVVIATHSADEVQRVATVRGTLEAGKLRVSSV
jgi:ABC-type multidrug transport system ATPase subunit